MDDLWTRRRTGRDVGGLIHHWDKGVHDVAVRYTQRSLRPASWPPVGSTGDSYDCETSACRPAA
jgi:putative transposase